MASSDVAKPLLSWVFGGIGALLVYSAYKTQSPIDVLKGVADTGKVTFGNPSTIDPNTGRAIPQTPGAVPGNEAARLRALATRELKPTLISIPGGGMLDIAAAASLQRINAKLGFIVRNVGAYRSYAQQASLWASDPNRFAPPTSSLHVVGLAIDVAADQMNRADVIAAFTAEGWHRARYGAGTRNDEPWHWSYGVSG